MKRFTDYLSRRLPLLIVLVGVGTFFAPFNLKVSPVVPSFLLGVVILFTGVSMNVDAVKEIGSKKRELFLATFLKWTVTVFISIGLAYLFFSTKPEIAAGLILAGAVPSATAAAVYTFLAGGNTSLVIASSLLDVIISPFITPLSMIGFANEQVSISFLSLLNSFLLIVIVPLSVGIYIQKKAKQVVANSKMMTKLGSSLALLLIVHIIVGSGKEAISAEIGLLPLVAVATFIQVILPMIITYFVCKGMKVSEEDSRASIFQVGLCNSALAAILAYQFIGELGVIAPVMNMMFNLSLGALISNYFAKEESRAPQLKPMDKLSV
jgi:BASS family bile acid:Na+ symporter